MNVSKNRNLTRVAPVPMTMPFDGWVEFDFPEPSPGYAQRWDDPPIRLTLAQPIRSLEFTEEDINRALDCLDTL